MLPLSYVVISQRSAYDNVHYENLWQKSIRHNTKYALINNNDAVPGSIISVFKDYPDLNTHNVISYPNREKYIKIIHLHSYIKATSDK